MQLKNILNNSKNNLLLSILARKSLTQTYHFMFKYFYCKVSYKFGLKHKFVAYSKTLGLQIWYKRCTLRLVHIFFFFTLYIPFSQGGEHDNPEESALSNESNNSRNQHEKKITTE